MRVSLFVTCLVDQVFPQVGLSTIRILNRLGVDVDFDERQACCGQPAFNSGHSDESRTVARGFLEAYADSGPVVVPSGSCATMLKVFVPTLFPPRLAGGPVGPGDRREDLRTVRLPGFGPGRDPDRRPL